MTIGGSDCSGGAGIQADVKTFSALGVYGTSVLTAVTAQNSSGVQDMQEVPVKLVKLQLEAIIGDRAVDYAKTGMLYSAMMIKTVAAQLKKYGVPFVLDPVMKAGSGGALLERDSLNTLIEHLLPCMPGCNAKRARSKRYIWLENKNTGGCKGRSNYDT